MMHLGQTMSNYRGDFLVRHFEKINDKIVLELAAGQGMVSENIYELSPAKYYLTDGNEEFFMGNAVKNQNNVHSSIVDILHGMPEFYNSVEKIDTVICCGYLYHTCHPLWAIEQILVGRPKWFYLESGYSRANGEFGFGVEPLNDHGMQTLYHAAIPRFLCLPSEVICDSIQSIGYSLIDTINNRSKPDELTLGNAASYVEFWVSSAGMWFERND
jgi:hypothetical protein